MSQGDGVGRDPVRAYAERARESWTKALVEWLRIPSVSALPEHAADCAAAAAWAAGRLDAMGVPAQVVPAPNAGGLPLVVARRDEDPALATVLLYGHYDVQPADPLDQWTSPPFAPRIVGDDVFARGADDNKGQCWAVLCGVAALLGAEGRLPVNLRVVLEGEEECGGHALADLVAADPDRLRADAAWAADGSLFTPGLPAIYTATRGIVYAELEACGGETDLHSGMYGGAAPNPLLALCHVLAGCKPWNGAVTLPGFYDHVQRPAADELAAWAALPFDEAAYQRDEVRAPALPGEHGYTLLERLWARPTFEVHGIVGGFVGAGAKTVIPSRAVAKISLRLVPDQDPMEVVRALEERVNFLRPEGVTLTLRALEAEPPVRLPTDHPVLDAGRRALSAGFGREPALVRMGGSLPALAVIAKVLGIPTVMTGFGLPDDRLHAPDEKFHLPHLVHGAVATAAFLREVGRLGARVRLG